MSCLMLPEHPESLGQAVNASFVQRPSVMIFRHLYQYLIPFKPSGYILCEATDPTNGRIGY